MKKYLLGLALLACGVVSAQTTTTTTTTTMPSGKTYSSTSTKVYDRKFTLSAFGSFPELNQVGLSGEFFGNKETKTMHDKTFSMYMSKIVQVSYTMMNYDGPAPFANDVDGQGFAVDLGVRNYFNGTNGGFYLGNYFSYGNVKFDENRTVLSVPYKFEGRYQYFSFFSPEIGYKLKLGRVAIDPFAGVMWKIEVKGEGSVDNKNVNNWTPRVGLKLGVEL